MKLKQIQIVTKAFLVILSLYYAKWASGESLINVKEWEKKVTIKKLDNGLTVILTERHEAPVFSAYLRVGVGSVDEEAGKTGLAHMFEHMAFKGTDVIGTTDFEKEKLALAQVENAYKAFEQERKKTVGQDEKKLKEAEEAFQKAQEEAAQFIERNEFMHIASRVGNSDLNAFTSYVVTNYPSSFPSNQFELWAYLESERMRRPVLREFYQERNIVQEERRTRTDSRPLGRLVEQFYSTAFLVHPYHHPPIGWSSDLQSLSIEDAQKFWEDYYTPSNMILSIAGDIDPAWAMPVIEAYFGRIPNRPKKQLNLSEEPPQNAERMVMIREEAEPYYMEGYHRGSYRDRDDAVYDMVSIILAGGRTSRLYKDLVIHRKIASYISSGACSPSPLHPCLFVFSGRPMRGHSVKEVRTVLHQHLEKLKKEGVSKEELASARKRIKVAVVGSMTGNMNLASMFAELQHLYGDWREGLRMFDRYDTITSEDIKRVAQKIFIVTNRTAAWIEKTEEQPAPLKEKGGK